MHPAHRRIRQANQIDKETRMSKKARARQGKCEAIEGTYNWGVLFCHHPSQHDADCIWGTDCADDDIIGHRHEFCHTHYAALMAYQN